jgi:acyl dehydratase
MTATDGRNAADGHRTVTQARVGRAIASTGRAVLTSHNTYTQSRETAIMDGEEHGPRAPVGGFTSAWVNSTRHFTDSVTHLYRGVAEANRALLTGGWAETNGDAKAGRGAVEQAVVEAGDGEDDDELSDELAYDERSWQVERTVGSPAHISVGDAVRFSKVLSERDVRAFAQVSGDTNRLHLDDEFAAETRFGRRIAHGTLVSGTISAALARLPGLTIYLSQDLRFLAPVDIGDRVTSVVEIVEDLGDDRYRLTTRVLNEDDEEVIDGEAVVLIDELPDEA